MQEIRSGSKEIHGCSGHRRNHSYSRAAAAAAVILAIFCFSERESQAQETKTMWGQLEKTTTTTELPAVYLASPGVPTFSLNVTGGAQWKAYYDFQHSGVSQGQFGIDYSADGTNRLYFYGGTTPYLSKWPAVQSVGDKCLHNDGAGDMTWGSCGASANWTEAAGVIYPTTNTNHVQVGGGASASELRVMEPSGGGTSYTGFVAPALAANVIYSMPTADGAAGTCLSTSGAKVLSWAACTGASSGWTDDGATVRLTTTADAVVVGLPSGALCCGERFALQGAADAHLNVAQTFYRGTSNVLGAAIAIIGTTAGDWVSGSAQNDFIIRGQSTVYLSSGTSGSKGYKLTETTHNWYVSDTSKMDLSGTRFYTAIPHYLADGTAAAPSLAFNSDVNTGMYWISADFLGLATGGTLRAAFSVTANNGVMNLYGNSTGGTGWSTGGIIASYDAGNNSKNLQFAVSQVGGYTGKNGTAALPFYSFADDEDIGMYRSAANTLAFAMGSSSYISMTYGGFRQSYVMHSAANSAADVFSAGPIIRAEDVTPDRVNIAFDAGQIGPYTGNRGTAALPFYSFEDDPNTGIYSSGADAISFSTGGTLRAEISGYAFNISGNQIIGARGAAVADAAGGATVDTEARAAINALLARLRTHGLIAP